MKKTLAILSMSAASLVAADSGVRLWKSADLKGYSKKLSPKIDATKIASEGFGSLGPNANAQISHREASGVAELHETVADVFVVQSGEAIVETGGEVVDAKTTTPHEVRGSSIKGGTKQTLQAGDIFFIPPKTPHQIFVDPGQHFTYFVIKVK